MTGKECKKFYPKQLYDTFCTTELPDRRLCVGDSGGGITAKIDGRTYLAGVVSRGTPLKNLRRAKPDAQLHTDITKYTVLIDSWLGAKKSK
ncbi:hypothetical protein NECAME_17365 [Necator americanus]|uniref:Peptidase S1 domain-containing protein n=1 Tax=Necator americanus TaxID=51031 RepID=W2TPU2_NECAM|nr:hypothetical protein NECAME_17365 [Necator americanus]ETN83699.1 hypothetical protein NECAME_17365 [Necator americanus]